MTRDLCLRLTLLTAAVALASCTDAPTVTPPIVAPGLPVVVSVSPPEATLEVGKTLALEVVVTNTSDTRLTFTSFDPATAVVGETGIVTCVAPGRARIEARSMADPGISSSSTITCTAPADPEPTPVEGLSISINGGNLSVTYTRGSGPCPMDVGTFTVTNNGTLFMDLVEITPRNRIIYTDRHQFSLGPGESREVRVFFYCMFAPFESFETPIFVTARAGSDEITRNARVRVTIIP